MEHPKPWAVLLPLFVFLDLCWAMASLLHDLPALAAIPAWAIPFIVICPLYPFLLACVWYCQWNRFKAPTLLVAVAVLPSSLYGLLSIPLYLLFLNYQGFSWETFLGIPWVLLYGTQGLYILKTQKLALAPALFTTGFLMASLVIQYHTLTYDYLNVRILPVVTQQTLALSGLLLAALLFGANQAWSAKRS